MHGLRWMLTLIFVWGSYLETGICTAVTCLIIFLTIELIRFNIKEHLKRNHVSIGKL